MDNTYECLKLKNQLCFPLYACSKEIIRRYKPFLDQVDLTYTQYIAMMALWQHECQRAGTLPVSRLGDIDTCAQEAGGKRLYREMPLQRR